MHNTEMLKDITQCCVTGKRKTILEEVLLISWTGTYTLATHTYVLWMIVYIQHTSHQTNIVIRVAFGKLELD